MPSQRLQLLEAELQNADRWPAGLAMFACSESVRQACLSACRAMDQLAAIDDPVAEAQAIERICLVVEALGKASAQIAMHADVDPTHRDWFEGWLDLEQAYMAGYLAKQRDEHEAEDIERHAVETGPSVIDTAVEDMFEDVIDLHRITVHEVVLRDLALSIVYGYESREAVYDCLRALVAHAASFEYRNSHYQVVFPGTVPSIQLGDNPRTLARLIKAGLAERFPVTA